MRSMKVTHPVTSGQRWPMTEPLFTALVTIIRRGWERIGTAGLAPGVMVLITVGPRGGVGAIAAGAAGVARAGDLSGGDSSRPFHFLEVSDIIIATGFGRIAATPAPISIDTTAPSVARDVMANSFDWEATTAVLTIRVRARLRLASLGGCRTCPVPRGTQREVLSVTTVTDRSPDRIVGVDTD